MAHALYLRGEYGRSLGMAENALIMKQGSYPISELFLHLSASMACMSLKDIDAAKAHFGAAWDIARPDGLIELIGEHHGLLQGLIEACLKTQYPDDFARIIEITYRFSYGWRRIHNPDSGEDVADDLTTTEFTMAMLACRGWTNAEIARHMGVSPGTVKIAYPAYTQSLASAHAPSWSRICCVSDRAAKHIERVPEPGASLDQIGDFGHRTAPPPRGTFSQRQQRSPYGSRCSTRRGRRRPRRLQHPPHGARNRHRQ